MGGVVVCLEVVCASSAMDKSLINKTASTTNDVSVILPSTR
jgi:hypothetical protein